MTGLEIALKEFVCIGHGVHQASSPAILLDDLMDVANYTCCGVGPES